jgi:hypothetical protein
MDLCKISTEFTDESGIVTMWAVLMRRVDRGWRTVQLSDNSSVAKKEDDVNNLLSKAIPAECYNPNKCKFDS